ncbi:MAG: aminotransferase class I/II-fold pyridoxal phosphate-dependent enzyme, partial [Candidatus Thermoplasmatota archaeon]
MVKLSLSKLVKKQVQKPNPIREIMKMADKENIIKMGLKPEEIISFAGGWVDHFAPPELIDEYIHICKGNFHKTGAYSPTSGMSEIKKAIAKYEEKIFGIKEIKEKNIIIGQSSTQLTHDLLKTLLDPKDKILLFDPTYANYIGQVEYAVPTTKILRLKALSKEWEYLPSTEKLNEIFEKYKPKLLLLTSPDNP